MAYYEKIVVSGSMVELYQFERLIIKKPFVKYKPYRRRSFPLIPRVRLNNIFRRKKSIRRLVMANKDLSKFITLTFRENITNLYEANYLFNLFIKRFSRRFPSLKYIAVPELTKKGRIHYHILANVPYIPNSDLAKIWSYGFVNIKKIKFNNHKHISNYIAKYITKDNSLPFFNKKRFFYSKNLLTAIILKTYKETSDFIKKWDLFSKVSDFSISFTNLFLGRIIYSRWDSLIPI